MMEIEQRAFIEDIDEFRQKIEGLGAEFVENIHIIDTWFCEKSKTKFEEVRQEKVNSYGLRIRQTDKTVELNCKVLKRDDDHNAFHEFETTISDFEQTKKILISIGFKPFCVIDKKRQVYKFEKCLINIEDIKNFKPGVELEIISDENIEENKEYLKNLLDKFEIKKENKIEKGITHLYMKEFAFKN